MYDNEDVDHSLCFFCGKVGLDDRVHLVHVGASPHDPHADGGDEYRDHSHSRVYDIVLAVGGFMVLRAAHPDVNVEHYCCYDTQHQKYHAPD